MRDTVLIFTRNNARVIYPDDLEKWKKNHRAIINPDLSQVRGVPPHYWKLVNGGVQVMTKEEQENRDKDIQLFGLDNDVHGVVESKIQAVMNADEFIANHPRPDLSVPEKILYTIDDLEKRFKILKEETYIFQADEAELRRLFQKSNRSDLNEIKVYIQLEIKRLQNLGVKALIGLALFDVGLFLCLLLK